MADNFKHKNTDLTLINDSKDLDLIRQYTEAYNKAYAEGDKAGQQAAHDAAEKIRAKYDYSGGVDGIPPVITAALPSTSSALRSASRVYCLRYC